MAELSGKIGAIYATYGAGTAVSNEAVVLVAGVKSLAHTNVIVSKVTSDAGGTTPITKAWYCTVKGSLVVSNGGTATVYVTYKWWTAGTYGVANQIGVVAGFFGWGADQKGEPLQTTDYSDVGVRTYIPGLKGWTGSAEKHWITEVPLEWVGTKLIIKLYLDNVASPTLRYEGIGIITGHGVTSTVETLVNESLSFQGDSVLTYEDT